MVEKKKFIAFSMSEPFFPGIFEPCPICCVKSRLPTDLLSGCRAEIWFSHSHIIVACVCIVMIQRLH